MKLADKVAMVTGASGGIGAAICKKLAEEGAKLALVGRNEENLLKLRKELEGYTGRSDKDFLVVATDVTNEEMMLDAGERMIQHFGRIDIAVNTAGGGPRGKYRVPFAEINQALWEPSVKLNLFGTIISCEAVVNQMIKQNGGKIINFGSQQGVIGGATNVAVYSAAKGAIVLFTKSLAKELAQYNINVNCISPGLIWNEPRHSQLSPEMLDQLKSNMWSNTVGQPEDVANLVLFLASEESNYITGQNFNIDGGTSLGW